ncbi:unnamed protein product [Penicillium salamii]|uniref:Uncharacterized protein n=1 Tax=Penicillium salamii TaxID=1612424 RepID=A0A9W4ITI6_9EURO|nr:unnamed protein product [Penicillium salamii]CAG8016302.1 unnamed protein product [Penicillium salamii]CAG8234864.1 unnamed protein product [Penicillium salamii]CAG8361056.1 unnamed protein product [Penicillium salamii]CAG8365301.1 unnamed protein product [Penicillium salamii]
MPLSLFHRSSPKLTNPLGQADIISDEIIPGDKDKIEVELERNGNFNALQRYRYVTHWKYIVRPDTAPGRLDTEEDLREVVQEEMSIKNGTVTPETEERLRVLNAQYWHLSQQWWSSRSGLSHGQLRAFTLWRSQSDWYMHPSLVECCTDRQGCCARGCGCCTNRKVDPSRSLGIGHCTVECACCQKARGFEVSPDEKKKLKAQLKIEIPETDFYTTRMKLVSIWGLCANDWGDKHDTMIDAPPSYGQIEKGRTGLMKRLQEKIQK